MNIVSKKPYFFNFYRILTNRDAKPKKLFKFLSKILL